MAIEFSFRLIVVGCILLLSFLGIWIYVKRNQSSSGTSPITPKILESKIQKGGIFMIGPSTVAGQALVYRDMNNVYWNAGTCSDCPNACAAGVPVQDIIKSDCSSGTCKPVLIQSASDVMAGYLTQAGKNVMTQVDCSVVMDTSGDAASTYVNNQIISMFEQDTAGVFISVWDFMQAHSDQLINLVTQFGEQLVLSQFIGEWSMVAMLLPGLLGTSAQTQFITGINLSVWGGKAMLDFLTRATRYVSSPAVQAAIEDGTLEWNSLSRASAVASITGDRAIEEGIAATVSTVLETVGEILGPVFDFVMIVQMVGMFLDIWDPCGLQNTLTADDLKLIGQGFDQALWSTMLQATGKVPVEWYAEYVGDYQLLCPTNNAKVGNKLRIKRDEFQKLTRNARDLSGSDPTDCENDWLTKSMAYQKLYQDSLTTNALGQCLRPLTQDEINKRCSNILGIPINLSPDGMVTTTSNKLQKALTYASLQVANGNQVIANWISTWWWILAILLIVLLVLVFIL